MELRKIRVKKPSFDELKFSSNRIIAKKINPKQIKIFDSINENNQFTIERYICPINKINIVITRGKAGYFV